MERETFHTIVSINKNEEQPKEHRFLSAVLVI